VWCGWQSGRFEPVARPIAADLPHSHFSRLPSLAVEELGKMHRNHLKPGFDENPEDEQAIEIATREITKVGCYCTTLRAELGILC
jgi:hypothetical protein